MVIKVNNTVLEIEKCMSIEDLIAHLESISFDRTTLDDGFMLTYNGKYVEGKNYSRVFLNENDLIELFPLCMGG